MGRTIAVTWWGQFEAESMSASFVLAVGVVLVCLSAALPKLRDRSAFARGLRAYGVLPMALEAPVSLGIIVVELCVAATLLVAIAGRMSIVFGAALAIALFVSFSLGLAIALARGSTAACHCFGVADTETISFWSLARAGYLLLASALLVILPWRTDQIGVWDAAALATIGTAMAVMLRFLGLVPVAWAWLRQPALGVVPPSSRLTFRYSAGNTSLVEGDPLPVTHKAILSIDQSFSEGRDQ